MKLHFFYGSLRTGYWNQRRVLSENAVRVSDAVLEGFSLFVGHVTNVPTVCPNISNTVVKGDLYDLDKTDTNRVAILETGYRCDDFEVILPDGEIRMARVYYCDTPEDCPYFGNGSKRVVNGDFTTVVGPRGEKRTWSE